LEIELLETPERRGDQRYCGFFERVPSKRTVIVLEHNGNGAMDRIPESATAFGHRGWPYNFVVTSAWSDAKDTDRNISWTREFFDAMEPFLAKAAYVNYLGGDEGSSGLTAAYGPEKLARLAGLKTKYDPSNLFRMNQNIAPASAGHTGTTNKASS
jgi:FAD/FMN-containing dehydrogenase